MATVSMCVCVYIYISARRMIAWLFASGRVCACTDPGGGQFRGYVAFTRTRVRRVGRAPFERRLRSHLHTEKSNGCNA